MKFAKSGFTLMELLVYMAIVGIIVVIAGEAFSNSTKFRIRTDNMIKATQVAENVGMLLKDDLAQMGAKSSLESVGASTSDYFDVSHISDVYMDPDNAIDLKKDSSSFRIVNNVTTGNTDSLVFRRLRYDTLGHYEAIEEVAWFLTTVNSSTTLKRQCVILDKKSTSVSDYPCAPKGTDGDAMEDYVTEMATEIKNFVVQPGIPLVRSDVGNLDYRKEQIFPPADGDEFKLYSRYGESDLSMITTSAGGHSVTLSGFTTNYDLTEGTPITDGKLRQQVIALQNNDHTSDSWAALCSEEGNNFTFIPKEEYEVSFKVPYPSVSGDKVDEMQMFVPGRDHMSVGFVLLNGKKPTSIPDFMFYPPSSTEGNNVERVMRFSVPDTVKNVCMAFTFAIYSPVVAKGSLTIKDLRLKRRASENYTFGKDRFGNTVTTIKENDKQNVKAFKLTLSIKRGAKAGGNGETGEVTLVIPAPSNGPRD